MGVMLMVVNIFCQVSNLPLPIYLQPVTSGEKWGPENPGELLLSSRTEERRGFATISSVDVVSIGVREERREKKYE